MQKNHFIQLIPSLNAANFRFMRPEWPNPFLIMHNPKIFQTTFNFPEFVSTYTKPGYHFVLEI